MKRRFLLGATVVMLMIGLTVTSPAFDLPYEEGTVWNITFIRTTVGMEDAYFEILRSEFKPFLDEAVKEKLILSYKILSSPASNREDWDLMLMMEFENMAALDGLDKKMYALAERIMDLEGWDERALDLNKIREMMGDKLARELILKEKSATP